MSAEHGIPLQTAAPGPAGPRPGHRHRAAAAGPDLRARRAQVRGGRRRRIRREACLHPHGEARRSAPRSWRARRVRCRAPPRARGGRRGGAGTGRSGRSAGAAGRLAARLSEQSISWCLAASPPWCLRLHREPQFLPLPDPGGCWASWPCTGTRSTRATTSPPPFPRTASGCATGCWTPRRRPCRRAGSRP